MRDQDRMADVLPEDYRNRMKELLGGEEYGLYLKSFEEERLYGLRVNTGKISAGDFKRLSAIELTPVPWTDNGFYYSKEARPAKDPCYYAGLTYLQEPSAMAPAALLPVKPGDRVLDLCAAPGGKSTQLGIRLKGQGVLVANDISNSRAQGLLKNLELWGITNIYVTSETPQKLADAYGEYFDRILVDAPCSGEGMFRKDPDMRKSYLVHGPEYYAPIQKAIVDEAVRMLRPGGKLLYSTCTFSPAEDEEVIRDILDRHGEMRLCPLPLFEGAADGIGLSGCIRLFPHRIRGEGHFIALLQKNGGLSPAAPFPGRSIPGCGELPAGLTEFLSQIQKEYDPGRILIKSTGGQAKADSRKDRGARLQRPVSTEDAMVYYLPEGTDIRKNLRYLRTGLLLGELKKGRFEPSQALAMSLKAEEFDTALSWPKDEERVIRYLKGETVALKPEEGPVNGWCLICLDSYPLGFAKGAGFTLKNKYYPGWRWQ